MSSWILASEGLCLVSACAYLFARPPKNKPSFEFHFPVKEGPGGSIKPQTSQPLITSRNADYSIGLIYFSQRLKKSTNSEIPQVENVAPRRPSNRREAFRKCLPGVGWPGSCGPAVGVSFRRTATQRRVPILFPWSLSRRRLPALLALCSREISTLPAALAFQLRTSTVEKLNNRGSSNSDNMEGKVSKEVSYRFIILMANTS